MDYLLPIDSKYFLVHSGTIKLQDNSTISVHDKLDNRNNRYTGSSRATTHHIYACSRLRLSKITVNTVAKAVVAAAVQKVDFQQRVPVQTDPSSN